MVWHGHLYSSPLTLWHLELERITIVKITQTQTDHWWNQDKQPQLHFCIPYCVLFISAYSRKNNSPIMTGNCCGAFWILSSWQGISAVLIPSLPQFPDGELWQLLSLLQRKPQWDRGRQWSLPPKTHSSEEKRRLVLNLPHRIYFAILGRTNLKQNRV